RKVDGCPAYRCSDGRATPCCGFPTRGSAPAMTFATCGTSSICCPVGSASGRALRRSSRAAQPPDFEESSMCPACIGIGSAIWLRAGGGSAGGVTALLSRRADRQRRDSLHLGGREQGRVLEVVHQHGEAVGAPEQLSIDDKRRDTPDAELHGLIGVGSQPLLR